MAIDERMSLYEQKTRHSVSGFFTKRSLVLQEIEKGIVFFLIEEKEKKLCHRLLLIYLTTTHKTNLEKGLNLQLKINCFLYCRLCIIDISDNE